jgi:hypothetical protein
MSAIFTCILKKIKTFSAINKIFCYLTYILRPNEYYDSDVWIISWFCSMMSLCHMTSFCIMTSLSIMTSFCIKPSWRHCVLWRHFGSCCHGVSSDYDITVMNDVKNCTTQFCIWTILSMSAPLKKDSLESLKFFWLLQIIFWFILFFMILQTKPNHLISFIEMHVLCQT